MGSYGVAQCFDCGTGLDGPFNATTNTTLTGGVHHFTTFDIAPGVTVRVTGTQPLEINATGAVNIQGTLDVSGLNGADGVTYANGGLGAIGVAGGGNGGDGTFSASSGPLNGGAATGSGAGGIGMGWSGGGGAGYSAVGGSSGGAGGVGGPAYGDPQLTGMTSGSGGGGGSGGYNCGAGGGGAGGGYVSIFSCVSITISGTVDAKGGNGGSDGTGNCGGGGGGSGGSIWLASATVTHTGSLIATGGTGGASEIPGSPYWGVGANGANGRIRIDANTLTGAGSIHPATGHSGTVAGAIAVSIGSVMDLSCFGANDGSATGTATGAVGTVTYSWSPSGGNGATATGLAAGCYALVVTDSLGCTDTDSICITEPPALAVSTSHTDLLCHGDCDAMATVAGSGGTPAYSYLWSIGATTDSLSNLCAGTITVTVTDANGCTLTESVTLSEPSAIALSETHVDATYGNSNDGSATVTASGGTPGYTYAWTPGGATTATINNLGPGTYACVVTDSNGCSDSISVMIGVINGIGQGNDFQMSIIPNPARDEARLSLKLPEAAQVLLEVFDLSGRKVLSIDYPVLQVMDARLDLHALPAGSYACRMVAGDLVAIQLLVIQK